jgi:hypothetical protein
MRPVAGWVVAVSLALGPAAATAGSDGYNPCKNLGTRRIAVVFAPSSGGDGECKGKVYPDRKIVCEGDTVLWSVINACDVESVSNVHLEGLERVTEKCTVIPRLELTGVQQIRCRLRILPEGVKQQYEVVGKIGKGRVVVDPELDIRHPR